MRINYARYRAALERQYSDRATIERVSESKDPITRETKQIRQTIYADCPCRISQTGLPRDGQTEDANDIAYIAKLFIAPDIELLQGDAITVQRGQGAGGEWTPLGAARSYQGGEPFPYPTHQEVSLTRKEWA